MTDETAEKFYKGLVTRDHMAMLEHAHLVFEVDEPVYNFIKTGAFDFNRSNGSKYVRSCYLHKTEKNVGGKPRFLVSGNLRAINESGYPSLLSAAYDVNPLYVYPALYKKTISQDAIKTVDRSMAKVVNLSEIENLSGHELCAHRNITYKITCDRGVTHELVRHRVFSFAMESTRYCAYNKDKFGGQITVVKPPFWDINSEPYELWLELQQTSEAAYMQMLDAGAKPEEARSVLTNSLKAEIIMTGNINAWDHFFSLRYFGRTGAPHPQMKEIAAMIYESFPYKEAVQ